jgi:glycosyltransferase involved in cell wall biosynthesis
VQIVLVGTYPPRRCGIATFTADVERALIAAGARVDVIAVDPAANATQYREWAAIIERTRPDAVLIQHEFGIYGPSCGGRLLELTDRLTIPYVVTLHTVRARFSDEQAAVLHRLCRRATAVTVFTETARRLMIDQQLSTGAQTHVVGHGAPCEIEDAVMDPNARAHWDLPRHAEVMATFGLLSEGKGIELAIRALAILAPRRPHLVYLVAGRTHPEVVRRSGDAYRHVLVSLAEELGVADRVRFVDRFLDIGEVASLLSAADVFCTPYRGEEQSVSGALTFALAAHLPVVSTPYRYARDVLSAGAGALVAFDDVAGFAREVEALVVPGPRRTKAVASAAGVARGLSWAAIGRQTLDVVRASCSVRRVVHAPLRLVRTGDGADGMVAEDVGRHGDRELGAIFKVS